MKRQEKSNTLAILWLVVMLGYVVMAVVMSGCSTVPVNPPAPLLKASAASDTP